MRENGIVGLVADRQKDPEAVNSLLVELGNLGKGLPFYAIYPGSGAPVIRFGTKKPLLSQSTVIELLREAGPSRDIASNRTAMAPN